jgi:DNA-binding GntR family transcriptional regulator
VTETNNKPATVPGQIIVERSIPTDPATRASASIFLSESEQQGLPARRVMLEVGPTPAPAHIAERMSIAPGDMVLVRRRLMLVQDTPLRIASSYFPLAQFEGTAIAQDGFVEGGLQGFFERQGLRFGRAFETLTARLPHALEAEQLEIRAETPVVVILRSSYDVKDRPVHTLETVCASDKHVFRVRQVDGDEVF